MFWKKKEKEMESDLAIVKTATSNYEFAAIQGLLEDSDIPFMVQHREAGSYMKVYMGVTIYGTDIIVSKDNLERAKEVLAVLDEEGEFEETEFEETELPEYLVNEDNPEGLNL